MKRLFTVLFLFFIVPLSFAQEGENDKKKRAFVAAGVGGGDNLFINGMFEFNASDASIYLRVTNEMPSESHSHKGKGQSWAIGTRTYHLKNKNEARGLFSANEIKYLNVKYTSEYYTGRYSYFSFFTPEIGYRFLFGKKREFGLELSGGAEWAIEIKGTGDVDNKRHDNWKPKAAIGFVVAF